MRGVLKIRFLWKIINGGGFFLKNGGFRGVWGKIGVFMENWEVFRGFWVKMGGFGGKMGFSWVFDQEIGKK